MKGLSSFASTLCRFATDDSGVLTKKLFQYPRPAFSTHFTGSLLSACFVKLDEPYLSLRRFVPPSIPFPASL